MIYVPSLPEPCQPAIKPHHYEDLLLKEMGHSLPVPPHVALHIWHLKKRDWERGGERMNLMPMMQLGPDIPKCDKQSPGLKQMFSLVVRLG